MAVTIEPSTETWLTPLVIVVVVRPYSLYSCRPRRSLSLIQVCDSICSQYGPNKRNEKKKHVVEDNKTVACEKGWDCVSSRTAYHLSGYDRSIRSTGSYSRQRNQYGKQRLWWVDTVVRTLSTWLSYPILTYRICASRFLHDYDARQEWMSPQRDALRLCNGLFYDRRDTTR